MIWLGSLADLVQNAWDRPQSYPPIFWIRPQLGTHRRCAKRGLDLVLLTFGQGAQDFILGHD